MRQGRNIARDNAAHKVAYRVLKRAVLMAYGGPAPVCACCGEWRDEFLAVHHLHNNGAAERRQLGNKGGVVFYRWLKREGFPSGYGVLCHNCNSAVSHCQDCSHKRPYISGTSIRQRRRTKVLAAYGSACACCSESSVPFLTIDHINGGGTAHVRMVGDLYAWLIRNQFPAGFRVLCFNCNMAVGARGYCPHLSTEPTIIVPPKLVQGQTGRRGEANSFAKLTVKRVALIKQQYAAGVSSQRKLAAQYGVHQRTVFDVIHGRLWA